MIKHSIPLLLSLLLLGAPGLVRAEETCEICHRQLREVNLRAPAMQWPSSVHGQHNVSCTQCHGGNGQEPSTNAHDPASGFVGHLTPMLQAERCGGCHGSTEGPRAPDEASDAWAQWRQSAHGQAAQAGRFAPGCADCHGNHAVYEVADPRSSVSRNHVVDTCASCHADPGLMTDTNLPGDEYDQYVESVHGRKLAEGDLDVPTCASCHDAHGLRHATDAAAQCKHCHEEIGAAFDNSRHREAFAQFGFVDCAECHGSHEVEEAGTQLIGGGAQAACRRCHGQGQPAFTKARAIGLDVHRAEVAFERASAAKQEELKPVRHDMMLAFHALDAEAVTAAASRIVSSVGPAGAEDAAAPAAATHEPEHRGRTFWSAVALATIFIVTLVGGALVARQRKRA